MGDAQFLADFAERVDVAAWNVGRQGDVGRVGWGMPTKME